jgi:uncharacterized protein YbbC (DUF1343 family)
MNSVKLWGKSLILILIVSFGAGCNLKSTKNNVIGIETASDSSDQQVPKEIIVGAERLQEYLPLIQNKKVGVVVNHTSNVGGVNLVDTLMALKVNIVSIFAPEHGFRGNIEQGKNISNSKDARWGIPVISIYGSKKKPTPGDLEGTDFLIFDMQDVGVRFFTYISTLHYVMEACAENNVNLLVLDRPDPLGFYIDGPVLDTAYRSFIGMHPVPVVYGMTMGEYACMINGEGWLNNHIKCNLKVVTLENYNHQSRYMLPVHPSPNLPDMKSVYLYPSICFFEGAQVNEGRGTDTPFQKFGNPGFRPKQNAYTPVSMPGYSLHPRFEGQECYGYDLSATSIDELKNMDRIQLRYLIEFYNQSTNKADFFNSRFFDLLAGGDKLRMQVIAGTDMEKIRKSWEPGIEKFKAVREKYLLYK